LKTFKVYQQLYPKKTGEESYEARLELVGEVEAKTPEEAITITKSWGIFKKGCDLGRFPIVKEVK